MLRRRHPRLTRWLLASLRGVVALVLVLVLPSRPAMAGCFGDLGNGARADEAGQVEREGDDCCPSQRSGSHRASSESSESEASKPAQERDKESSESGCPCHDHCPSGCTVACGLAAVLLPLEFELGIALRLRAPDAERVADPPRGVGPEILHVPR